VNLIIYGSTALKMMAERVGFEPTEPVKAHSISNAASSTTPAPFRARKEDKGFKAKKKALGAAFFGKQG
jgi:hypothetical protein